MRWAAHVEHIRGLKTWKLKGQLAAADWFLYCKMYCLLNNFAIKKPVCCV